MSDKTIKLQRIISEANAGAFYPDLSGLSLSDLEDLCVEQITFVGRENHRLKTYLAILLMRTIRDFTDTDTGVYKSQNAVDAIVTLCQSERDVQKRIRAQNRRVLCS